MPDARHSTPNQPDAQGGLSREEIAARGAAASTPGERRHWQVIALLADQTPLAEIVAATSYQPRTLRQIAQQYRQCGPAALVDQRAKNPGAAPILSPEQQRELKDALQHPPSGGGSWTGPKVAQWIASKTGRHVHRQRGWDYLRRLAENVASRRAGQSTTADSE